MTPTAEQADAAITRPAFAGAPAPREAIDVVDPATGRLIAVVPSTTADQLDDAVDHARTGFRVWSRLTPNDRDEALNALAHAITAHADELAELEAANTGRPLAQARGEVATTARQFRFYGGTARVMEGKAAAEYVVRPHLVRAPRPARRHRSDHAVELSARDGGLEARPRTCGR